MKRLVHAAIGCAGLCALVRPVAAGPACDPVAIVEGDPALVSSLQAHLLRRGIASDEATHSEPDDGCPPVHASVARDEAGLRVVLTAASGASEDRVVSTAAIAATWIESRVRVDVGAPLLAVRLPPPDEVDAAPAGPGATPPVAIDAIAPRGAERAQVSLVVRTETLSGDEQSGWSSYSAGACAMFGPVCVGALARFAADPDANVDQFLFARRSSEEVLATAAWPLHAGRVTVLPTLGVGVGWLRTRQEGEPLEGYVYPPEMCEFDPSIPPEYCRLPEPLDVTTRTARVSLGLDLAVPLGEGLALDLGAGIDWALGAHTDAHVRDVPAANAGGMPFPPDGTCGMDPGVCDDRIYPAEWITYPGEPGRVLRAGIGLRVGVP